MRVMSFSMTKRQFLDRSKDVTRRLGWETLQPGQRLRGVEKAQGLKKGEKVKVLGVIEVVRVRREPVRALTDDLAYGFDEIRREGFGDDDELQWPSAWVPWFCKGHGCTPETVITRIEFRHVEGED